ncbi:MAG: arylsulfatase [Proteobacteria bacterium]|nr:MAG: arylsulfatase [Pseudomonadota bacterium]
MTKPKQPTRRDFLKATGALALASGLGGAAAAHGRGRRRPRPPGRFPAHPNVLFLLVDEMRYPPVYEAGGLARFRTRYLRTQDELRRTGIEFHRHYAASTACAPSRTSIFTGQYPSLHGVSQTTGAAKSANDPDVFWLETASVPTLGDWFQAGGYRSFYRGKWHVSDADLQVPGTHAPIPSYDDQGQRDPAREALYQQADRLAGFGFEGWIGPEPHGSRPLDTGSSPSDGRLGRDQGFASQTVDLIGQLDASRDRTPWLLVSSFVNPHDIALWGWFARHTGEFDFDVEDVVPAFAELFDPVLFEQTLGDDLSTKPSCQESYRTSYHEWMQAIPPEDYFRFYYQLHKNVDEELGRVYQALRRSRFFDDTIVVFTSDHGDLLGAHGYMHQKWYQTYDEALRVPLILSNRRLFAGGDDVHAVTSHVDLLPTLLGLCDLDPAELLPEASVGHSDALPPVGRDLSALALGRVESVHDPIFFMTDDDPSRGLDQENVYGIAYDSVIQPNHIEAVIVELDGVVWKYSRYFDNVQYWSDPAPLLEPAKDVVITVQPSDPSVPGERSVPATERVKFVARPEEREMYDVTNDPLELRNLAGDPAWAAMELRLARLLDEQRAAKRLVPRSGDVPGQPTSG